MSIEIYKALSDESRLRMLNLLIKRELCVCEIELILNMTQSNVSRHLNKLKNAKIILSKKESRWVYYSVDEKFIEVNYHLYKHLKNSFEKSRQYVENLKKLNLLKEKNVVCEDIRNAKRSTLVD